MEIVTDKFVLFTRNGCSWCQKAKEFLSEKGVDFINVDVEKDAAGRERMLQLGARLVPALAKGDKIIAAKILQTVAEFVGVKGPGYAPLPPQQLFDKWRTVLRAAQRFVRQVPQDRLLQNARPNRNKSLRLVTYQIFCIGEGYLECIVNGDNDLATLVAKTPADGTCITGAEIAHYGDGVIANLEQWWAGFPAASFQKKMEVIGLGTVSIHQILERSTWHSAHHTRQLADVLQSEGIEPDGKLTKEDLAGLPLPQRLWDA